MVKKFYMGESKPGSIEDAILGVWKEAAQEVDEKLTDRQRAMKTKYLQKNPPSAAAARNPNYRKSTISKQDITGRSSDAKKTVTKKFVAKGDKSTEFRSPRTGKHAGGYQPDRKKTTKLAASFSPEEIENFEMIMDESVSTPEIEAVWAAAAENDMSGEHSFELGTDRYREHTQEMTPGQSEKKEVELDETNKNDKSDDGEGLDAVQKDAVKKKFKNRKDKDIDNDGDTDDSDEFLHKKRKAISKAIDAKESFNLRDTIVNMWVEASSAVNPNDRDELDKEVDGRGGAETAKKMKKAKEPTPMVATEDLSVEEAQKQKNLSMKEALAKVWGFEEGYGKIESSKKKKMTPESKNGKTTETGGKMAEVEIDPELKDKK